MTKLQVIYNNWNETQKKYYKDILEALLLHNVQTDQVLLQKDSTLLSNTINVQRQRLRAFIKQVQLDVLEQATVEASQKTQVEQVTSRLSTGFESLDKLLSNGFQFNQIIELCGESDTDKMSFVSRLLGCFINDFSKDNIFIFDTSGLLEPRRLNTTSDIECFQDFNLKNLLQSMENVAALISSVSHDHPPLIVIDDPSKLIGFDWSVPEVSRLVKFIEILARDMNACVIILQQSTTNKANTTWKSVVDLRVHISPAASNASLAIQVLDVRHKTVNGCTVNF